PYEWDAVQSDVSLKPKDRITLAFDGSKSGDWAALVACRVEDAALFLIKAWNPEHYDGNIPRTDVDQMVANTFSRYDVVGWQSDVSLESMDRMTLALDGVKSGDWAALVGCRVEDAGLFLIKAWDPEHYDGNIPRTDVDPLVANTFSRYGVVSFRSDVKEFES